MDVSRSSKLMEQMLEEYSFGDQPDELYRPMSYMMELDDKRICPSLTLWSCHLFSGKIEKALKPALGVWIFHNFLLLHADLLDRNPTRNGQESVYVKWNNNVAILSGDAMIFKSYDLLIQVETPLIKPIIGLFNRCFARVCETKQQQFNTIESEVGSNPSDMPVNSGALIPFCLEVGALVGGANSDQLKQLANLGNALGALWGLENNSQLDGHTNTIIQTVMQDLERLDCESQRIVSFGNYLKEQFSISELL